MRQSQRKLIGTVLMLVVLALWAIAATAVYDRLLTGLPNWVLLPYFIVAGLGWAFPAMAIIRWMVRPPA